MEQICFLAYASENDCKTTEALLRIREHASKQSSVKREEEYDAPEDADLLPTLERLRRAFPGAEKEPETLRTLRDLLKCDCHLCKPQRDALKNARREADLPLEIVNSDEKLKAFAALALSGCLFALREFLRSNDDDIDDFLKLVTKGANPQIRSRLFPFTDTNIEHCGQCNNDGPVTIPLPQQCLQCVAKMFRDSVRPKVQLMKVRRLKIAHEELEPFYGHANLPFISEHQVLAGQPKAVVKFSRCNVERSYCEVNETELFRKRYKFNLDTDGAKIRDAETEAKIALFLRNRNTPGIAKILMAFTEHREDLGFTFINLVFRREHHTLKDYFREATLSDQLLRFPSHNNGTPVLLEHGLWKSLLEIVEAIASIHEAENSAAEGTFVGTYKLGHLDIKPANILIGPSKNLLLTDFGQAARRTMGTNDYAPPEMGQGGNVNLVAEYDIWSLACLLTEALVFIKAEADLGNGAGPRALQNFSSRRRHQTTSNQSAAFWMNLGSREEPDHKIRSSVLDELNMLESIRHPQTQRVIRQMLSMLSIDPRQRPDARACQKQFKTGVGREIFRNPGDVPLEPQLQFWKTSFTTRVHHDPIPCRLFLHQVPPDEIDLTLECDGDPMYLRPEIARLSDITFQPISFHHPSNEEANESLKSSFSRLLRGIILHFLETPKFFEFMTLMTHQKLLPDVQRDPSCSGAFIRFKSCEVEREKSKLGLKGSRQLLTHGFVQVWECLGEREYNNRYRREPGPGSDSSGSSGRAREPSVTSSERVVGRVPDSERKKYKMVLFASETESRIRTCIVVDIGTNTFTLNCSSPAVTLTRASKWTFQAVAYNSNDGTYPGIPCSPEVIDHHFRDEKRYMKLANVKLTMQGDRDYQQLQRIITRICGSN